MPVTIISLLKTPRILWERACPRLDQRGLSEAPSRLNRGQARSHSGYVVCSLALAISLAGCAGLPDQRLANEALKRGDTTLAAQNYQQLADLGYSEAQVGLADLQVDSRDPAQIKKAEATYRAAASVSPRAQARLGRLLVAKPGATEAEHHEAEALLKKASANGEGNTLIPLAMLYLQYPHSFPNVNAQQQISQWRTEGKPEAGLAQVLLYRTQGTYDQHLDDVEKICKAALNTTDICYVELATVYQKRGQPEQQAELIKQMQAGQSRGVVTAQRVDSVARVLGDASLGKTDEKTAQSLLEGIAPGYPASWVSLAQLLYDFPELGDVDTMMKYLDNGRAADQPRAELLLGKLYFEGKMVPADAKVAEEHFKKAVGREVAADYYLGQIYRRGYLGKVYPQKALDHLLTAARNGQNSADFAIAQLFSQGKGTRPDPVNAYVFSQLAKAQNTPQANELAQTIETQLPPDRLAEAQRLLKQEQAIRSAVSSDTLELHALQEEDGEESL
ncbi:MULTISPECIES: alginate biosynthesis TPR repeat lipoprotein AlgK [Pseudomonas]|uniref:alginate biosynthesis TPR repeat lipoprotein AlgK n=1 Tax=Pseudomonas TaxID=286 RepID=UPI00165117E3|nr:MULTISPECIES: alginate biosynthesis TPR repeat lipoprotein AlgK [Gammaproteobacteria]MBK5303448.1 alginate biosynthesis TPR repeat lipoprotein AlgK [Bacillus sp. TH86]MBK5323217.1 alginate biosynthesis TPR repeat lipoprotein AlgK [Bacillus sp. TH59]MBK5338167.1 alginate biosynthesis TPR repeat lipoprotein AlgK [Bacillus sp. TH57]MBK5312222.1 alginate biosynthesis TPR repeat lipoprotein AlgK [Pseudomonas sp. TH71]MBK5317716.1 alginate biosynthesis TPR repeat lipoprotein AlgK [Erwinia sp. TH7